MMKSKYIVFGILALAVIGIFFIILIQQRKPSEPACPQCPSPNAWSECNEQAVKTRTNYKCAVETNYICINYLEEKECQTSLTVSDKDLEATVSPMLDENVKGIIKIEATKVPSKTTIVEFIYIPQGVTLGQSMSQEELAKLILVTDKNPQDGWKTFIDTTQKENGLYTLFIGATYEGAADENPWISSVSTQVVVKN